MAKDAPLVAAIPVRNRIDWTRPLVEHLLGGDEVDEVWVYDNGSTDGTAEWLSALASRESRLVATCRPNARLYGMWNEMVARAASRPSTRLAILNNDIRLPAGALRAMSQALDSFEIAFIDRALDCRIEQPVRFAPSTWRDRTGWAFMIRSDFWAREPYAIDPGLQIWWGDDDLARRAQERGGRLCVVRGVGCFHAESQSAPTSPIREAIEHDRRYFARLWDEC